MQAVRHITNLNHLGHVLSIEHAQHMSSWVGFQKHNDLGNFASALDNRKIQNPYPCKSRKGYGTPYFFATALAKIRCGRELLRFDWVPHPPANMHSGDRASVRP